MKDIITPFWLDNPRVLIDRQSITEIFPSKRFDIIRKLNAIVRLSVLYSVVTEYKYSRITLPSIRSDSPNGESILRGKTVSSGSKTPKSKVISASPTPV